MTGWDFFTQASFLVQLIILSLVFLSCFSWYLIVYYTVLLRRVEASWSAFEATFWSGNELTEIYHRVKESSSASTWVGDLFSSGFQMLVKMTAQHADESTRSARMQKTMSVRRDKLLMPHARRLSLLASIGSISPYVGLLGTVLGIMHCFAMLGVSLRQASLSLVAPSIGEALMTTALGLFVAIPAVVGYNRLLSHLQHIEQRLSVAQDEIIEVIEDQLLPRHDSGAALGEVFSSGDATTCLH
jgi:biopolymer transport protein TolQ